jgi:hypothetical protein
MPDVSLTAKGGALFPVTQPFIPVGDTTGRAVGYCLAIMRNDMAIGIDIIGRKPPAPLGSTDDDDTDSVLST